MATKSRKYTHKLQTGYKYSMTQEKYQIEFQTLKKFFEKFCQDKHNNQQKTTKNLSYKDTEYILNLKLCQDCDELIEYSLDRLNQCPHETKPRCRTCDEPCYKPDQWKKVAKLMRYSGIRLGLIKIKKRFKIF